MRLALTGEEFRDPNQIATGQQRHKGGGAESRASCRGHDGGIRRRAHVLEPDWRTARPYLANQALTQRVTPGRLLGNEFSSRGPGPDPLASAVQRLTRLIRNPELPDVPAEALADRLEHLEQHLIRRSCAREAVRHGHSRAGDPFTAPSLRDVADEATEGTLPVHHERGDRELDREFVAIAVHCEDLQASLQEVLLAGLQVAGQGRPVSRPHGGGHDRVGKHPTDGFLCGPAEKGLSLRIPSEDPSLLIHRDHGVEGGADDRLQPGCALLRGASPSLAMGARVELPSYRRAKTRQVVLE